MKAGGKLEFITKRSQVLWILFFDKNVKSTK